MPSTPISVQTFIERGLQYFPANMTAVRMSPLVFGFRGDDLTPIVYFKNRYESCRPIYTGNRKRGWFWSRTETFQMMWYWEFRPGVVVKCLGTFDIVRSKTTGDCAYAVLISYREV